MSHENNIDQIRVGIAGLGRSGWGIHANAMAQLTRHFNVVAEKSSPLRMERAISLR